MEKFRYKIKSPNFPAQYVNAPDGWKNDESVFPRSDTYKGIFRKFSANTLTFYGEAAQLLRDINAQLSFESEATLTIEEADFETYDYFQRFKGDFDFVTFKDIDGNDGKSIEINVIDSAFWNKVKNRENIQPQLSQLESLDGFQITGFTNEEQWITMPEIPDTLESLVSTEINAGAVISGQHASPLEIVYQEDTGVKDVTDTGGVSNLVNAFYQIKETVTKLSLHIIFETIFLFTDDNQEFKVRIKQFGGVSDFRLLGTYTGDQDDTVQVSISTDEIFTDVAADDYFILAVEKVSTQGEFEDVPPYSAQIEITAQTEVFEEVQISGMLVHEALARNLQLISSVDNPLYSELIGRKNSEPRSYAEDGELSNLLITSGERIRGFTKDESPITLSFKDLFTSLDAITPIGIGIEVIDGADTIRLEKLRYFFDDRIVLTIENASNVVKTVLTDKIINKISVGYTKAEYEQRNGLNEYNQKSEFSTPISVVQNELNVVSKIRADNNAIVNARAKPKSDYPTEDTRYDSDNFFITLISSAEDNFIVNGDFENWTTPNTADDWNVSMGSIIEQKTLLGSTRCYFQSDILGIEYIYQSYVLSNADDIGIQLSYENIGTANINSAFAITIDIGGNIYTYNPATELWVLGDLFLIVKAYFALNYPFTDENLLQSFQSYSLNIPSPPAAGTITVYVISNEGLILDDISAISGGKYLAKTNEGYTTIENTPFGDNSLNLDITPARNLLNHGSEIRAGLENRLGQYIKFNTSEKNSTAITQKDTETSPVIENADVLVADLADPYLKPIKWDCDIEVDKEVIDVLNETFTSETKRKYLGMFRFRMNESEDYKYVWLLDLSTGGETGQGKLTGVEVDLNYVTPVEI